MAAQTASKTTTKPVTQHKRRPHKKSRHGCGSCKKFHVKCDESGPPCGNCILRQVPCEYPTIKGPKGNRSPSLAAYSNQHSDSASSRSSTPSSHQCPSHQQQPSLTLSPWGSDRLLELELMHRWCTRTYTGFVAVPEDAYYCMGVLPRLALEYSDVLLSTIMATAALDTAMTSATEGGRGSYARIAMQYYDKASAAFRDPALSPTPENHHILVFVAAMLVIFNLAISQITTPSSSSSKGAAGGDGRIQIGSINSGSSNRSSKSRLAQIEVTFGLLSSSYQLAQKHMDWLLDSPWSLRTILSLGQASPDILDKEHKAVFTRLRLLNRKLHSQAAAVVAGNNNTTRDMAAQDATMAAYPTGPVQDSIFVSTGEPDDGGYEMDAVMDMIDPRIIQSTHHDFATVVALAAANTTRQQQQPKLKTMRTAAAEAQQHQNLCCSPQPAENNNYMQTQADVDVSFDYYQKVIAHLERFYAEDARDAVRCFLLAYPTLARRDLEARRCGGGGGGSFTPWEPLELLLLAHWALLLHRTGRLFWWVGSSGRDLVTACSEALEYGTSGGSGGGAAGAGGIEWEEAVAWVRRQVRLPPGQTGRCDGGTGGGGGGASW